MMAMKLLPVNAQRLPRAFNCGLPSGARATNHIKHLAGLLAGTGLLHDALQHQQGRETPDATAI
jgi:hypothetical protein